MRRVNGQLTTRHRPARAVLADVESQVAELEAALRDVTRSPSVVDAAAIAAAALARSPRPTSAPPSARSST